MMNITGIVSVDTHRAGFDITAEDGTARVVHFRPYGKKGLPFLGERATVTYDMDKETKAGFKAARIYDRSHEK